VKRATGIIWAAARRRRVTVPRPLSRGAAGRACAMLIAGRVVKAMSSGARKPMPTRSRDGVGLVPPQYPRPYGTPPRMKSATATMATAVARTVPSDRSRRLIQPAADILFQGSRRLDQPVADNYVQGHAVGVRKQATPHAAAFTYSPVPGDAYGVERHERYQRQRRAAGR